LSGEPASRKLSKLARDFDAEKIAVRQLRRSRGQKQSLAASYFDLNRMVIPKYLRPD
jgi:hypothetical protein